MKHLSLIALLMLMVCCATENATINFSEDTEEDSSGSGSGSGSESGSDDVVGDVDNGYCDYSLEKNANVVTVSSTQEQPINTSFWGTNILIWEDNDEALNGGLKAMLAELPLTNLRYPGGTVAENFDWETSDNISNYFYPFNYGPGSSNSDITDLQEFMALCEELDVEPVFVVNTQTYRILAHTYGDFDKGIAEGAAKAAAWVQYCKDNNFKARYWEIGNEIEINEATTAEEYGKIVVAYSEAMKAVDPTILISANGPLEIDEVGFKDLIKEELHDTVMDMYANVSNYTLDTELKTFRTTASNLATLAAGEKYWWDTVLPICKDHIDMITVHWYFAKSVLTEMEETFDALKEKAVSIMGYEPMIIITEYNTNTSITYANQRVVSLAEGMGRFLKAGVDVANYWPNMWSGDYEYNCMVLDDGSYTPLFPYYFLKNLPEALRESVLECEYTSSDGTFFCLPTRSDDNIGVLLTSRSTSAVSWSVEWTDLIGKDEINPEKVTIKTFAGTSTSDATMNESTITDFEVGNGFINLKVPAATVALINIEM